MATQTQRNYAREMRELTSQIKAIHEVIEGSSDETTNDQREDQVTALSRKIAQKRHSQNEANRRNRNFGRS